MMIDTVSIINEVLNFFSGAADTDEALQRRKESYRQELQEQIAEQHRNKKRWVFSDPRLFSVQFIMLKQRLCDPAPNSVWWHLEVAAFKDPYSSYVFPIFTNIAIRFLHSVIFTTTASVYSVHTAL